jgi:hypothetical protein
LRTEKYGIYVIEDGKRNQCNNGYATGHEICKWIDCSPLDFSQLTGLPYFANGPPANLCDFESLQFAAKNTEVRMNTRWKDEQYKGDGPLAHSPTAHGLAEDQKWFVAEPITQIRCTRTAVGDDKRVKKQRLKPQIH